MRGISEVEHRHSALVPRLRHDVASGNRNERPVVRDAVLQLRLNDRQLVVAGLAQIVAGEREDRVSSPFRIVCRAALWSYATAPLVTEQHLARVIAECRGMPVREV